MREFTAPLETDGRNGRHAQRNGSQVGCRLTAVAELEPLSENAMKARISEAAATGRKRCEELGQFVSSARKRVVVRRCVRVDGNEATKAAVLVTCGSERNHFGSTVATWRQSRSSSPGCGGERGRSCWTTTGRRVICPCAPTRKPDRSSAATSHDVGHRDCLTVKEWNE